MENEEGEIIVHREGWPWANDAIVNQVFHINIGIKWFSKGKPTDMFYVDMSRFLLLAVFMGIVGMVWIASINRRKAAQS
jgi:hypothetical protein